MEEKLEILKKKAATIPQLELDIKHNEVIVVKSFTEPKGDDVNDYMKYIDGYENYKLIFQKIMELDAELYQLELGNILLGRLDENNNPKHKVPQDDRTDLQKNLDFLQS